MNAEDFEITPVIVTQALLDRMREFIEENLCAADSSGDTETHSKLLVVCCADDRYAGMLGGEGIEDPGFSWTVFTEQLLGAGLDEYGFCERAGAAAVKYRVMPAAAFFLCDAAMTSPGSPVPAEGALITGRSFSRLVTSSFLLAEKVPGSRTKYHRSGEFIAGTSAPADSPLDAFYRSFCRTLQSEGAG